MFHFKVLNSRFFLGQPVEKTRRQKDAQHARTVSLRNPRITLWLQPRITLWLQATLDYFCRLSKKGPLAGRHEYQQDFLLLF